MDQQPFVEAPDPVTITLSRGEALLVANTLSNACRRYRDQEEEFSKDSAYIASVALRRQQEELIPVIKLVNDAMFGKD